MFLPLHRFAHGVGVWKHAQQCHISAIRWAESVAALPDNLADSVFQRLRAGAGHVTLTALLSM